MELEMKRHEALQPFSRDHNVGLVLARNLSRADAEDQPGRERLAAEAASYWREEMEDHFAEEERLLAPLASPESARRLKEEHAAIAETLARVGARADTAAMRTLGRLLDDHIRWEERQFFVEIEQSATPQQLDDLAKAAEAVEDKRADSRWSPRRGELMRRRKTEP